MALVIDDHGVNELHDLFKSYAALANAPSDFLVPAAEAFVKDLKALPRPRSQINSPGRTHLIDSFAYEKDVLGIEVGWGVPYGPYVEHGQHPHRGMRAQPHFKKTWKANERKYAQLMQQYFNSKGAK